VIPDLRLCASWMLTIFHRYVISVAFFAKTSYNKFKCDVFSVSKYNY